jgi:hypothetical protein
MPAPLRIGDGRGVAVSYLDARDVAMVTDAARAQSGIRPTPRFSHHGVR